MELSFANKGSYLPPSPLWRCLLISLPFKSPLSYLPHTCKDPCIRSELRLDATADAATTATTQQRAFLQTEAASTLKAFIGFWSAATFRPPPPPAPPPPPPAPPPPRRSRVAQPRRMLTSLLVAHLEGPLSSIVAAAAGSFHMAAVMLRERQPWQP